MRNGEGVTGLDSGRLLILPRDDDLHGLMTLALLLGDALSTEP